MKSREGQRGIEPLEKIINVKCVYCTREQTNADRPQDLHVFGLGSFAVGGELTKRTSNSVQSFSEQTRRKSPSCKRASSRARFKPSPCPEMFVAVPPR